MLTDRNKIIQKWRPVIESVFSDIRYLIPYIEDEVSYQLELKRDLEGKEIYVNVYTAVLEKENKLPKFLKNVHTYLIENIPTTYLENMTTCVNPMTGEILYKYKENFLDIKSLQKTRIQDFLLEIDFYNVAGKLYDNNPKKYIRQLKLKKLNGNKDT